MSTVLETHIVHFSIDGEWLTDFIRQGWSEGRYEWAFKALEYSGCSQEYHYDILRGNLKMVGVNEMRLEKDDWKPDLASCHRGTYPDPTEIAKLAETAEEYKRLYFERLRMEYYAMKQRWDEEPISRGDFELYIRTFPEEFIETLPPADVDMWLISWDKKTDTNPIRNIAEKAEEAIALGVPSVDEFVEHQRALDEKEQPKPDRQYISNHGWILPNGDFYPCGYMEHIWLVGTFDKTEQQAENEGWIKVGQSVALGWYIYRGREDKPITQAQIDSVNAWCLERCDVPSWVKENDDWYEWAGK